MSQLDLVLGLTVLNTVLQAIAVWQRAQTT